VEYVEKRSKINDIQDASYDYGSFEPKDAAKIPSLADTFSASLIQRLPPEDRRGAWLGPLSGGRILDWIGLVRGLKHSYAKARW